jgi:hypothetical protein
MYTLKVLFMAYNSSPFRGGSTDVADSQKGKG